MRMCVRVYVCVYVCMYEDIGCAACNSWFLRSFGCIIAALLETLQIIQLHICNKKICKVLFSCLLTNFKKLGALIITLDFQA